MQSTNLRCCSRRTFAPLHLNQRSVLSVSTFFARCSSWTQYLLLTAVKTIIDKSNVANCLFGSITDEHGPTIKRRCSECYQDLYCNRCHITLLTDRIPECCRRPSKRHPPSDSQKVPVAKSQLQRPTASEHKIFGFHSLDIATSTFYDRRRPSF